MSDFFTPLTSHTELYPLMLVGVALCLFLLEIAMGTFTFLWLALATLCVAILLLIPGVGSLLTSNFFYPILLTLLLWPLFLILVKRLPFKKSDPKEEPVLNQRGQDLIHAQATSLEDFTIGGTDLYFGSALANDILWQAQASTLIYKGDLVKITQIIHGKSILEVELLSSQPSKEPSSISATTYSESQY